VIIAVSGKGGTGKTFVASVLVTQLRKTFPEAAILAVDADPDANLAFALGLEMSRSIGDVREQLLAEKDKLAPSVTKREWLDGQVFEVTIEGPNCDLLIMGRPEGRGCYCSVNHLLRNIIDSAKDSYDHVVIDAEAGLEHLSRTTTRDVDTLVVVTDQSLNSLKTACSIRTMSNDLKLNVGKLLVVGNKIRDGQADLFQSKAQEMGLDIDAIVPFDEHVTELDLEGRPVASLKEGSPALAAVTELGNSIFS